MSFRRRVALSCTVAVALAVVVGSVLAYVIARGTLRGEIDASLRDQVSRVPPELADPALRAAGAAGGVTAGPAGPAAGAERAAGTSLAVGVRDDQLSLLVGGPQIFTTYISKSEVAAGGKLDLLPAGDVEAVAKGQRQPYFADRTVRGVHVRVFTTRTGGGAIQVARPLTEVDAALRRLRWGLGALALAGIALAVFLSRLAMRAAVRPVTQLTETAEHVARTQDLSLRIEATGEDEMARLAGAFNTMLAELERSQRSQRALVADASHELRTPLTSLRTNLEVLVRDGRLAPEDAVRLRRDLIAQLEELTGLVGDLVELARDDEPESPCAEELRLDELVEDAVERARRHAPGVCFTTALEPLAVRGVPARLDRAVANLLDNAAKWSPPGATVEVRLRDCELTVRDHGPGIAPADVGRVFDRFFRAAEARGRPGSGLGLAIVRQVAEGHGGSVSAEAADGGGALLRLRLPASQQIPSFG
jgi:two-component system sensor histidine kinase MprB